MDKNIFWQMIEQTKKEMLENDLHDQCIALQNKLYNLSCEDILKFKAIFDVYHQLSYKMRLWAAAYVINSGCSDTAFDHFRAGLILQGKYIYLNTLKNPDHLAALQIEEGDWEVEEVFYICSKPFLEKSGLKENAYEEFLDAQQMIRLEKEELNGITSEIEYGIDIDIEWDESDLAKLVPKLCKTRAWYS